ncbi:MAG: hypothetical protein JSR53_17935 [Proteobacteria bacterium]|nr:hypothetical protein [Pseudomonadota bacterium]
MEMVGLLPYLIYIYNEKFIKIMQQEIFTNPCRSALTQLENYFVHTNQVLGVTGFGCALACVGLDLSPFFSWISIVFLIIAWGDNVGGYKRHINALQLLGVQQVRWPVILWRTRVAILGWLALASVAFDLVNKHGIVYA